jgi:O-6-methylguanine DNA methyltransferase
MKTDDDRIIAALEGLRTTAPASLLDRTLAAAGLADRYATVEGPVGRLYVSWNDHGVSCVAPAAGDADFEELHAKRVGRPAIAAALPASLGRALERALATGTKGSLPLDLRSVTEFQRDVLAAAATIPPGEVRSYGWVAREIGSPSAARAVGSALNRNPVPILIPCHRVGRSDGSIGGYAFGEAMKRDLLRAEGLDPEAVDAAAARGVRFVGSDTTRIFCHPTCHNARRITDAHRVEFGGERDAVASGYRACKACKPAAA